MSNKAKIIGFHLLGWVIFIGLIIAFVSNLLTGRDLDHFLSLPFLFFVFVYLLLFYGNSFFLLPRFYLRKKYLTYFSIIVLLFIGVYILKPFERFVLHSDRNRPERSANYRLPPEKGSRPFPLREFKRPPSGEFGGRRPQQFDIVSAILFIAVWAISTALEIIKQWRLTERRAMQAETDKTNAELSFLKAQINPHFLFNTLNNIYSLAITKSEHTPDAVLKLSRMLRYITDDAKEDMVPLKHEIACANNYIDLQRLRLSKKVDVEFIVEGDIKDKMIAPLVFMTFIENAFKYGISNHEDSFIHIGISTKDRTIHLFCRNRIIRQEESERNGIGIANAKKRLDYIYPGKYQLNIDAEEGYFTVDLTINT